MSARPLAVVAFLLSIVGCAQTSRITFPAPDELFITSGDGNIQKPYTPVGEIIHFKTGYRLPLPIFGLLPISDVDPDAEIRNAVFTQIRSMGGDALINMRTVWTPAKSGFLGLFATGGSMMITGTVIKR